MVCRESGLGIYVTNGLTNTSVNIIEDVSGARFSSQSKIQHKRATSQRPISLARPHAEIHPHDKRSDSTTPRSTKTTPQRGAQPKKQMDDGEYQPPHEPELVPPSHPGSVKKFCVSPTNGRLEWIQAVITQTSLNKGTDITPSMSDFLLAGDKNPHDKPALIIHKSLGGTGDDVFNVFLEGRSFNRDIFDNEIESTVYYALKDRHDGAAAVVTVRFVFKDAVVTRPYKLAYQVELPNGDIIENELVNV